MYGRGKCHPGTSHQFSSGLDHATEEAGEIPMVLPLGGAFTENSPNKAERQRQRPHTQAEMPPGGTLLCQGLCPTGSAQLSPLLGCDLLESKECRVRRVSDLQNKVVRKVITKQVHLGKHQRAMGLV